MVVFLPGQGRGILLFTLLFLLFLSRFLDRRGWGRLFKRLILLQLTLMLPAAVWRLLWWGWSSTAWIWVMDWSIRLLVTVVLLELLASLGGARGGLYLLESLPGVPSWLLYLVVLVRSFLLTLGQAWTEGGRVLLMRGGKGPWRMPGIWSHWLVRQLQGLLLQARCLEHGLGLRGFSGVYPGPPKDFRPELDKGQIWLVLILAVSLGGILDGTLPL